MIMQDKNNNKKMTSMSFGGLLPYRRTAVTVDYLQCDVPFIHLKICYRLRVDFCGLVWSLVELQGSSSRRLHIQCVTHSIPEIIYIILFTAAHLISFCHSEEFPSSKCELLPTDHCLQPLFFSVFHHCKEWRAVSNCTGRR